MVPWQRLIRNDDLTSAARRSRIATGLAASVGAGLLLVVVASAAGNGAAASAEPRAVAASRPCTTGAAARIPQPTARHLAAAGLNRLPVAPRSKRLDLVAPPFSSSTNVTNPLFPISKLLSAILNGRVGGKTFRVETTLLPDTRIIEWSRGRCVRTLVSQYVAYLDGRIEEVALDFYAQADDGSVWYFGEDVYNYANGVVADTSGTWLAGKEGPAAMIMPAAPKVGDVHRPENIPGLVFEEVAVKSIGTTVNGPRGPVRGAMVGRELHDDGTFSDKVFAPGYGEFFTAHEGDVEALAVAVPADALAGPVPGELARLLNGANAAFATAPTGRWKAISAAVDRMTTDWLTHRARGVPPRFVPPTGVALEALRRAAAARATQRTRSAALDVAQAALDLELRYLPPSRIDRDRFDLWLRQVLVDTATRNRTAVSGDVATLEWIRDRIAYTLDSVAVTRIDTHLEQLREHVADKSLSDAAETAARLRKVLAASRPAG